MSRQLPTRDIATLLSFPFLENIFTLLRKPTRLLFECLYNPFAGDYRPVNMDTKVSEAMVASTLKLLAYGVQEGFLHPDYVVVGASDLRPTASPGQNLYDVISTWDHFDKDKYKGLNCDQICGLANATAFSG